MSADWNLALVAALLRRGRALDSVSTGFTLVALASGLICQLNALSAPLCALLLVAGLLQKYWAVRVALDAELFQALANSSDLAADSQGLDRALIDNGLVASAQTTRSWPSRCQGALKLLKYQAATVVFQFFLGIVAVLVTPWFSFA
ncbi:hypothetical protein [Pseudomonas sp. LRF_L74]|uniref:hypothetical protein n=1 Tax=Pseudomonas sp. LRF_L74 TaxID=3369422 RepID=UPI003F638DC9